MQKRVVTFFTHVRGWRLIVLMSLPVAWTLTLLRWPASSFLTGYTFYGSKNCGIKSSFSHDPDDFEFSIKPIAYVFPQFHPIPENDQFWGINFTEWTNVRKVTHNNYGLETLRPTEEVGYYNLLDYSTRARQAKLIQDSGIYGIAYHHYWFGRPVMDNVLVKLLEDREPNVPFMLSWANEP